MLLSCIIYFLLFSWIDSFHLPWKSQLQRTRRFEMIGSNVKYTGKLRPGKQSPRRTVPQHILQPDYAISGNVKDARSLKIPTNSELIISKMREAGRFAREVLDAAINFSDVGVTTDEIDALVHEETIKRNCYPSPLNYSGFPKSCCTSINEVICHGIPDSTKLQDGDIVNIDVTVYHDGVHGDCSETVLIGKNVSAGTKELVHTTYQSLQAAIAICRPGVPYNRIGGVIESIIKPKGYSSCSQFGGHGIAKEFHRPPFILHVKNFNDLGVMEVGHTFTIEPMICQGSSKSVNWGDDWTATTSDGLLSAQFEHTLLITNTGVEMLTAKLPTSPKFFWEQ